MLGVLVPVGGGDNIPLQSPRIVIGRRSSCDIVLTYPNISSQHCELLFIDGYWQVRDLGSRNGIKVNGERCDKKWLHPGDEISIAKNHYEISFEPQGEAPPEEDSPFEMSLLEKAGLQKREEERRRNGPPPAVRPVKKQSFSNDEDAAMDWLMGDE